MSLDRLLFAAVLACAATSVAPADDEAALSAALEKIERLEATLDAVNSRLAQLEQEDQQAWLDESRAAQIRGVVLDVLADAESRASFQSDGALAGYQPGRGFFLQSADGNFSMRISGQIQVRYDVNSAGGQGTDYGFSIRRAKISFAGNIIDPSWTYRLQGAFNRGTSNNVNTGTFDLEEAWIAKDFGGGWSMKLGQFKAPYLQEDTVSSRRQLAVERSLISGYFAQAFDRGIQLQFQQESFRLRAWTGNGIRTPFRGVSNSVTSSNWNTNPTRYAVVGRGEVKFGDAGWRDFEDFNSFRGATPGVMLGVSGMTQGYDQSRLLFPTAGTVTGVTADATVNLGGASLFTYFVWEQGDDVLDSTGGFGGVANPWGALVQGGYFLTDTVEVFGRYEHGNVSRTAPGFSSNALNLITVGANWFISRHDLKFTVDWGINLDSLGRTTYGSGFGNDSGAGYRPDLRGEEYQWALRAQMQLLF